MNQYKEIVLIFTVKKWALLGWGPSSQDNSESTEAQTLFQTWL